MNEGWTNHERTIRGPFPNQTGNRAYSSIPQIAGRKARSTYIKLFLLLERRGIDYDDVRPNSRCSAESV